MNLDLPRTVLLVGGGLASVAAVQTLRAEGYDGAIRLVSDEAELPYDRPPLSKAYLNGEVGRDQILLHDAKWYDSMQVDLVLGRRARGLDPAARLLTLADGSRLHYDALLLATGATARALPDEICDADAPVHVLRSRADADRLKALASPGKELVLIGGGVIGMEVAATLVQRGCTVTVVEADGRIMARFFPPALSQGLAHVHAGRGVRILTGVRVRELRRDGQACRVHLSDGSTLTADGVLVGIGATPNTALAEQAQLNLRQGGIEVGATGRTSAPGVYASGDVATFPTPDGTWTRCENWTHARLHAAHAARHMLGRGTAYDEIPWVWSDQYDFNLQVLGAPPASAEVVTRGAFDQGRLIAFHLQQGVLAGATLVNEGRSKAALRKLLARRARISPDQLADPGVDLKKLAATA